MLTSNNVPQDTKIQYFVKKLTIHRPGKEIHASPHDLIQFFSPNRRAYESGVTSNRRPINK